MRTLCGVVRCGNEIVTPRSAPAHKKAIRAAGWKMRTGRGGRVLYWCARCAKAHAAIVNERRLLLLVRDIRNTCYFATSTPREDLEARLIEIGAATNKVLAANRV